MNFYVNNYINKSSAVAEMGDRLATINISRKVGDVDMPSRPLTWSITPRHVKNIINLLVTAED